MRRLAAPLQYQVVMSSDLFPSLKLRHGLCQ
jgi:hypothetical protein